MKIGNFDTDNNVFIIAEIGNNHEGDFKLACDLVEAAANAGADAVKFQTIVPDRLVSSADQIRLNQLNQFSFNEDQFKQLKEIADSLSLIFLSTPFDLSVIDWLDELVPAYKIASGDNDFWPLFDRVANTGKPVLVSLGLGKVNQLIEIKNFFEKRWETLNIKNPGIAFLHCVVSYPTPDDQAFLSNIFKIRTEDITVGYSDHTLGIKAAELAVASGARIIEKHFTLNKKFSDFRDHQLSCDPEELKLLVETIRKAEQFIGFNKQPLQDCEKSNASAVRRSISSIRDMSVGEVVTSKDLCWLRPKIGYPPGNEHLIIGKKLISPIQKGEAFLSKHFILKA
jgi:N,N'-diacetyllegionaminate synthase